LVSPVVAINSKLDSCDTFLIFTPSGSKSNPVSLELLKYVIKEKNSPVVYISLDIPYTSIKRVLEKEQVDFKAVIFIDAITFMSGIELDAVDNCTYIRSPENLTDISIALSEALNSLSAHKTYVILDSMSTLFLYNRASSVIKFVHILAAKIKQYNGKALVVSTSKELDEPFKTQVLRFFDCSIGDLGG